MTPNRAGVHPVALPVVVFGAFVLLVAACSPAAAPSTNTSTPGSTDPVTAAPTTASTNAAATPLPSAPPTLPTPDLAGKFAVGDHSLYIECYGTSGPVIVFESGSGGPAIVWKRNPTFLLSVDDDYRRCVYDRANAGKSDRDSSPRTAATSAAELHALLIAAELPGPYVLAGRSFGGYVSRLFAAAYPTEVSALILVETLTPEFHRGLKQLLTPAQWAAEVQGVQSYERPLDVLASTDLVADATLPPVPLLVITGTKFHGGNQPWPAGWPGAQIDALWGESQAALAASVPGGRLVVFEGGDHSLQISQPERLAKEMNDFLATVP